MSRERWRPVVGFPNYSVSDRGRVRRDVSRTLGKAGSILKAALRNGYPFVTLMRDGKKVNVSIHQAVTAAFLGPCPEGLNINHRDGRRSNPRLGNLEYGTQSHNVKEAYRLGLRDCRGEGNGQAKLTKQAVRKIRKTEGSNRKVAALFGVSETTIRAVRNGTAWSHV